MEQSFVSEAVFLAVSFAVCVVFVVALRRFRRFEKIAPQPDETPAIDVEQLGDAGPAGDGPRLEFYNVPVRLAGIVLAATGRDKELPEDAELQALVDQITPGLGKVFAAHRPAVWRWPPQLSVQGFTHVFFARAPLPGDSGKGTRWSAVAGRFEGEGQKYVAGLLLCAASANNLGQLAVERETQWLDVLRVRS